MLSTNPCCSTIGTTKHYWATKLQSAWRGARARKQLAEMAAAAGDEMAAAAAANVSTKAKILLMEKRRSATNELLQRAEKKMQMMRDKQTKSDVKGNTLTWLEMEEAADDEAEAAEDVRIDIEPPPGIDSGSDFVPTRRTRNPGIAQSLYRRVSSLKSSWRGCESRDDADGAAKGLSSRQRAATASTRFPSFHLLAW